MKESTKQRRHDEQVAKLLGTTVEEVIAQRQKEESGDKVREVQAIFLFLEKPEAFMLKICDRCKGSFLTNYKFVSVCSSICRIKSLEKMGIIWNPMHTAENRWHRAQVPAEYSIPPAAVKVLIELAKSYEQPIVEPDGETSSIVPSYNDALEDQALVPHGLVDVEEEDWMT